MEVAAALRRGVDRTVSGTGSAFMGVFLALEFLTVGVPPILFDTAAATSNVFATAAAALAGILLSIPITVIAFRSFAASGPADPAAGYDTHRIGTATVNMVAGALAAAIIIGLGFILIIPGFFLLVVLLFWPVIVAVEDKDFVDAFRTSWQLTAGHRWNITLLVLGILTVLLLTGAVTALLSFIVPGRIIPALIISAANAFTTVFSIAAVTDAYTQLTA
jgi:hypothetical protein